MWKSAIGWWTTTSAQGRTHARRRGADQIEELRGVEIERRRERREPAAEHLGGGQAVRHVEREVADGERPRLAARELAQRAEAAHEDRVGRERREVAIDLLLARLADARRRDAHEARRARASSRSASPVPGELEEVEVHAVGARIERGASPARALRQSTKSPPGGGRRSGGSAPRRAGRVRDTLGRRSA